MILQPLHDEAEKICDDWSQRKKLLNKKPEIKTQPLRDRQPLHDTQRIHPTDDEKIDVMQKALRETLARMVRQQCCLKPLLFLFHWQSLCFMK